MANDPRSGLTLVEMLIAVSLLSLLSVGMLVAMRLGFSTMDKLDTHLIANRRVANSRAIIESELDGFVFAMANYRTPSNSLQPVLFFQMEPQIMRFITSYSLQDGWRGRPQIAVLQVIPGDAGVRLIVNETPYTGPDQAGRNIAAVEHDAAGPQTVIYSPVAAGSQSFVLSDRLAYCRFSYLEERFQAPFLIWRTAMTGPQRLPRGVRIEMAPIDTASSDLHVTTVTVPINVNRKPGQIYADQY